MTCRILDQALCVCVFKQNYYLNWGQIVKHDNALLFQCHVSFWTVVKARHQTPAVPEVLRHVLQVMSVISKTRNYDGRTDVLKGRGIKREQYME